MIYEAKTCKDKILVDEMGRHIKYANSFNDETGEAEIFLTNGNGKVIIDNKECVRVKVVLKNAKMINKPND